MYTISWRAPAWLPGLRQVPVTRAERMQGPQKHPRAEVPRTLRHIRLAPHLHKHLHRTTHSCVELP